MKIDLLRVARRGKIIKISEGKKIDFCIADFAMAEWERFYQERSTHHEGGCESGAGGSMGLSRGWTDIYESATPGNYVNFGPNWDGRYVLRVVVDPTNRLRETNEMDNTSYAYIKVHDNRVRVMERGYGNDPWDPNKEVVLNWWRGLLPSGDVGGSLRSH